MRTFLAVIGCILIFGTTSFGAFLSFNPGFKLGDVKLITKKRGVYLGYERGLYDVAEFGMEFQRKRLQWSNNQVNSFCFGFNYNVRHNILGYGVSYWHRQGMIGLTYGGDFIMVTDFKNMDVGIAPVVGFRFSGFHLQTGYKFLIDRGTTVEANRFFIRLRFTIHKKADRDLKW